MTPTPLVEPSYPEHCTRASYTSTARRAKQRHFIHNKQSLCQRHIYFLFTHILFYPHRWYDSARTTDAVMLALTQLPSHILSSCRWGLRFSNLSPPCPALAPRSSRWAEKAQARFTFEILAAFCQGKGVKPRFNPVVFAPPFCLDSTNPLSLCPVVLLR